MALFTNLADVHENRPFKPRYAKTQATAQAWKLGKVNSAYPEIVPGMCMKLVEDGTTDTAVMVPAGAGEAVAGFCGNFKKEIEISGNPDIAVWVLGSDAIFATETYSASDTWSSVSIGADLYSDKDGLLTSSGTPGTDVPAARFLGIEGKAILIAGCL